MVELVTRFGVLRPRLLPTVATIATVAILLNLAAWQVRRHEYKNRHQPAREAAESLDLLELDAEEEPGKNLFRRVRVTGHFAPPIMLEGGRSIDFVGGYGVLQPFETRDGLRLLIDRGEVHRDGMEAVLARLGGQSGPVTLEGQLRPIPDGKKLAPIEGTRSPPIWPRRGLPGIHAHVAGIVPDVYLRMGKPFAPNDRARPDPDVDPDLASGYIAVVANYSSAHYAKQWAAIAAVAVMLWLWASLDRTPARRESDATESTEGSA